MGADPSRRNEWGDPPLNTLLEDVERLYVLLRTTYLSSVLSFHAYLYPYIHAHAHLPLPKQKKTKTKRLTLPLYPPNRHPPIEPSSSGGSNTARAQETVQALVTAGADLRVQNHKGDNALHLAGYKKVGGCVSFVVFVWASWASGCGWVPVPPPSSPFGLI